MATIDCELVDREEDVMGGWLLSRLKDREKTFRTDEYIAHANRQEISYRSARRFLLYLIDSSLAEKDDSSRIITLECNQAALEDAIERYRVLRANKQLSSLRR